MPPSPIPRSFRSRYNPGPMQAVTPKPAAIVAAKTTPPKAKAAVVNAEAAAAEADYNL